MDQLPSTLWSCIASCLAVEDVKHLRLASRQLSESIDAATSELVVTSRQAERLIQSRLLAKLGGGLQRLEVSAQSDAPLFGAQQCCCRLLQALAEHSTGLRSLSLHNWSSRVDSHQISALRRLDNLTLYPSLLARSSGRCGGGSSSSGARRGSLFLPTMQQLPHLTRLEFGCIEITPSSFAGLAYQLPQLKELHLGRDVVVVSAAAAAGFQQQQHAGWRAASAEGVCTSSNSSGSSNSSALSCSESVVSTAAIFPNLHRLVLDDMSLLCLVASAAEMPNLSHLELCLKQKYDSGYSSSDDDDNDDNANVNMADGIEDDDDANELFYSSLFAESDAFAGSGGLGMAAAVGGSSGGWPPADAPAPSVLDATAAASASNVPSSVGVSSAPLPQLEADQAAPAAVAMAGNVATSARGCHLFYSKQENPAALDVLSSGRFSTTLSHLVIKEDGRDVDYPEHMMQMRSALTPQRLAALTGALTRLVDLNLVLDSRNIKERWGADVALLQPITALTQLERLSITELRCNCFDSQVTDDFLRGACSSLSRLVRLSLALPRPHNCFHAWFSPWFQPQQPVRLTPAAFSELPRSCVGRSLETLELKGYPGVCSTSRGGLKVVGAAMGCPALTRLVLRECDGIRCRVEGSSDHDHQLPHSPAALLLQSGHPQHGAVVEAAAYSVAAYYAGGRGNSDSLRMRAMGLFGKLQQEAARRKPLPLAVVVES